MYKDTEDTRIPRYMDTKNARIPPVELEDTEHTEDTSSPRTKVSAAA